MRCAFSVPAFPKSHSDRTFIRLLVHLTRFLWSVTTPRICAGQREAENDEDDATRKSNVLHKHHKSGRKIITKCWALFCSGWWMATAKRVDRQDRRTDPSERRARARPWQLFRSKGEGGTNNLPRGGRCGRISESVSSSLKRLDEKSFIFCFMIQRLFFHYWNNLISITYTIKINITEYVFEKLNQKCLPSCPHDI